VHAGVPHQVCESLNRRGTYSDGGQRSGRSEGVVRLYKSRSDDARLASQSAARTNSLISNPPFHPDRCRIAIANTCGVSQPRAPWRPCSTSRKRKRRLCRRWLRMRMRILGILLRRTYSSFFPLHIKTSVSWPHNSLRHSDLPQHVTHPNLLGLLPARGRDAAGLHVLVRRDEDCPRGALLHQGRDGD
jgi:hypothetical protein